MDLASTVSAAGSDAMFCLAAGTYRLTAPITPKAGDAFFGAGEGATILRGDIAIPADHWTHPGLFVDAMKDVPTSPPPLDTTDCSNGTLACDHLDDLAKITGDTILKRVLAPCTTTNVVAGTYCIDYAAQTIYMKDDPASVGGVSYATASGAFSGGTGVVLSDLTAEHFAGTAVGMGPGSSATHLEASFNHVAGVALGDGAAVMESHIHDNGFHGVGGPGDGIVFASNEVDHNGGVGYDGGTGTGGAKFSTGQGYTVTGNSFHDNLGNGLWFDVGANGATVTENTMTANHVITNGSKVNGGNGLRIEVSCNIAVTGNTMSGNDRVGAAMTDVVNVAITANTFASNAQAAIRFTADTFRGPSNTCNPQGLPRVPASAMVATGNTVTMGTGTTSGYSLSAVILDAASHFDGNAYHVSSCASAFWTTGSSKAVTFAAWQTASEDRTGTCGA